MITVYVCGAVNLSVQFRSYAWDGATINWGYSHGATLYGIAIAPDNRIAICGEYYGQVGVRVLSETGAQLWSFIHGATSPVRAVAFDSSGNLIIGGDSSSGTTLRKLDYDGNVVWSKSANGARTRCVAVDSSGRVYAGGADGVLRRYLSDGTTSSTYTHNAEIYGVSVDSSDNVYLGGVRYSSNSTRKLNSSMSLQWSKDHGNTVYAVAVDGDDNLITAGAVASSTYTTRKYAPDGTLSWSANHGDIVYGCCTDIAGNVYTTGVRIGSTTTRRYLPDGTLTVDPWIDWGATSYGVQVRWDAIPSIPLGLGLAAPQPLREIGNAALLTGFIIYRCYLTGGSGTIEIPISSFQSRRRVNSPTWISVVSQAVTDTMVSDINARTSGQLIIKRGVKYPDDTEQLDELMRADFESLRVDKGATSASLSIDGRGTETTTAKTRILQGISYRPTTGGARRVRCAVDTYLQPGDTADLGGAETMPVAEIVIWVSTTHATMEVAET
ncbi:MAG: WD40 repeat domain-containing protein [Bdellovibrionaceae bacterium]|nr:WD40 repeat domain-containing protein [Pseudobdellovibrionaceae bacterium]